MVSGFTFIFERKQFCLDPTAYTFILKKKARKEEAMFLLPPSVSVLPSPPVP
jgi:hypothetical protein